MDLVQSGEEAKIDVVDEITDENNMEDLSPDVDLTMGADLEQSHKQMLSIAAELESNKKSFLFFKLKDGAAMNNLKTAIRSLVNALDNPVPTGVEGFSKELAQLILCFNDVEEKCNTYEQYIIGKDGGKSKNGKNRMRLTRQLKSLVTRDRQAYEIAASDVKQNIAKKNKAGALPSAWKDILKDVRSRKVDINDKNVKIVGVGTSRIYRVDEGGRPAISSRRKV